MSEGKITREQHDRVWALYIKTLNDLNEANSRIHKLGGQPLTATVVGNPSGTLSGPISIGVCQCPRCGQWMELEKQ